MKKMILCLISSFTMISLGITGEISTENTGEDTKNMQKDIHEIHDPCAIRMNSNSNGNIWDLVVGGWVENSDYDIQYHAWEAGHRTGKSVFGMYYFDDYYSKYQKADHRSTGGIEITNIGKCPGGAGYVMGWHPGMNYWDVKDKYPNVEIKSYSEIPEDPDYSHYLNTGKQYRAGYEQKEFKYLKDYNDCY